MVLLSGELSSDWKVMQKCRSNINVQTSVPGHFCQIPLGGGPPSQLRRGIHVQRRTGLDKLHLQAASGSSECAHPLTTLTHWQERSHGVAKTVQQT